MTPSDFINAISPAAKVSAVTSKIPASFTIAEAALESGWASSKLASKAMNLFGVKADASWHGDVLELPTREFLNGEWTTVQAKWRKYSDWQGCIDDHAQFLLNNQRYRIAFGRNYNGIEFGKAIAAAGYATDPSYADKIASVINSHNLMQFDETSPS